MKVEMQCEYSNCSETKGRDYKRKVDVSGWKGEPIFLCEKHSEGFEPIVGVVKVKSFFKLKGLSRKASFTCEPLDNENIFWAKSGITQDRFNALWDYCKGNWKDGKQVEIEHEGLYEDGTPINPVVISIKEA